MAITQPIFKLGPSGFAWQQIQIIHADNDYDDDDDDKYNDDDGDDNDDHDHDHEKPKWPVFRVGLVAF